MPRPSYETAGAQSTIGCFGFRALVALLICNTIFNWAGSPVFFGLA